MHDFSEVEAKRKQEKEKYDEDVKEIMAFK